MQGINTQPCLASELTRLSRAAEFGGAVDSESLLEFVDQGGNLLLAVDAKASDELRGLISDLGVDLEKGNTAIDYQSAAELRGDHDRTLVSSDSYGAAAALFGGKAPQVSSQTGIWGGWEGVLIGPDQVWGEGCAAAGFYGDSCAAGRSGVWLLSKALCGLAWPARLLRRAVRAAKWGCGIGGVAVRPDRSDRDQCSTATALRDHGCRGNCTAGSVT